MKLNDEASIKIIKIEKISMNFRKIKIKCKLILIYIFFLNIFTFSHNLSKKYSNYNNKNLNIIKENSRENISYLNKSLILNKEKQELSKELLKIYAVLFDTVKNMESFKPINSTNNYINYTFNLIKGLGICTICKNENLYIKEFIEYYIKLGIKKIILYDNNDIDDERMEEKLKYFIKNNFVEIVDIRGLKSIQIPIYNHCYKKYSDQFDYLSFLDVDEFITINNNLDLIEYLYKPKFQSCETILLNWEMYGDNNLERYDSRIMIKRFTKSNSILERGKSIVRTNIPNLIIVSSMVIGLGVKYFCDSNGNRVFPRSFYNFKIPKNPMALIKHFYTKTAEEFCNKINKGDVQFDINNPSFKHIINGKIKLFMELNKITNEKLNIIENCTGIILNEYRKKVSS